jgi:hypothetical protein
MRLCPHPHLELGLSFKMITNDKAMILALNVQNDGFFRVDEKAVLLIQKCHVGGEEV